VGERDGGGEGGLEDVGPVTRHGDGGEGCPRLGRHGWIVVAWESVGSAESGRCG
jgi:hypothetical protein